ncbi:DUF4097 domain-containing protein [Paenibacillus hodogayensis]|uniref:DUF4097 domain-containing protein n=1 Tax=Paenibacillus hodogayensis TaxID=279208 RepID=A0ABV5VVK0_9BACL
MKKIKLSGLVLIALLVWIALSMWEPGKGFSFDWHWFGTKPVEIAESFDAGKVSRIAVETDSKSVRIVRGNSDKIEVRLQGRATPNVADQYSLKSHMDKDTLRIGIESASGFSLGFRVDAVKMTVELPDKQWNELKAKTASGNITVDRIDASTLEAATSSGNIELADSKASAITLQTKSGNVQANGFRAETLNARTGSGNIKLENGEAKLKADTSSGNIRVRFAERPHDAELNAVSGNVTVSLDREPASLAVDYRGGSGHGAIDWKGFQYEEQNEDRNRIAGSFGSGETLLKVSTRSGNFKLGH